jgi:transposase InsO family protein
MTGWTTPLRAGLPVSFDGEQFTIAEIEGNRVMLRRSGAAGAPSWRQMDLAALLSHPSTRILAGAPEPQAAVAAALGDLGVDEDEELTARYRHVQEVRTGYQHGFAELALDGEPRPQYAPGVPMMARYKAKAAELGVGVSTVRRWVVQAQDGPAGLVAERPARAVLDRADPRWLDTARQVIARHVTKSRPVRGLLLTEIEEQLAQQHGPGVVPVPSRTVGYELLRELDRGTNSFTGSTKGKRSIANRPPGAYGRLQATRPGEYVVLDTNRLDVFAMEPVTCRWVQGELSVAMDLYSRVITGLRLTPVSTKSVDIAGVLFETVYAPSRADPGGGALPYCGVPSTVLVDPGKLVDARGRPLLPSVAAETIVFDHGKVYLSNHIKSVCEKFGISLQPARPYTPTDKPVERWFRTLGEGLLAALPGYKGPDVYSRGEKPEQEAFFFLNELEQIIREWTGLYHRSRHRGLAVPEFPGLQLSPLEMLEHGITRAGPLMIPARPDMALEFLEVEYVTIQHYGVEIDTLRYNGEALNDFRNQRSTARGAHAGKWPVAVDSGDFSRIWFQDLRDVSTWHELKWEHAGALGRPFSREAAAYARKLAAATHRFPDTRRALAELLDRWGAGLTANRTERRMAVRLSQERLRLAGDTAIGQQGGTGQVAALPALQEVTSRQRQDPAPGTSIGGDGGEDDEDAECDAVFPGEEDTNPVDEDEFYAGAWDTR